MCTYICACVYMCVYVFMLSFHVCKYYVSIYACVCKYLQGTSVKGRSHFLCGSFSDVLLTCVFYRHVSRIWYRHEWMRKDCTRLCINSLLLSSALKNFAVQILRKFVCFSQQTHTHYYTNSLSELFFRWRRNVFSVSQKLNFYM